jgi:hypothetical protein
LVAGRTVTSSCQGRMRKLGRANRRSRCGEKQEQ